VKAKTKCKMRWPLVPVHSDVDNAWDWLCSQGKQFSVQLEIRKPEGVYILVLDLDDETAIDALEDTLPEAVEVLKRKRARRAGRRGK